MPIPANHHRGQPTEKWAVHIRQEIHCYFQRMSLPYGTRQNLLAELMEQFYDACKRAGILSEFQVDKPEELSKVLASLSFGAKTKPRKKSNAA